MVSVVPWTQRAAVWGKIPPKAQARLSFVLSTGTWTFTLSYLPERTSRLNLVSRSLLTWPDGCSMWCLFSDFSGHSRQVAALGVCVAPMPWDNCQPRRRALWLCSVPEAVVGSEVLSCFTDGLLAQALLPELHTSFDQMCH